MLILQEPFVTQSAFTVNDPIPGVKASHDFFDQLGLSEVEQDFDPNIQDGDGLVSYIVASTNPPPSEIRDLYDEIVPVMEGLSNVIVSALLKITGDDDEKKHDPKVWAQPFESVAQGFCSGFSSESKGYNNEVRGVEVASKMINIITDAVVGTNSAVFKGFVDFLESQGETIRLETSSRKEKYQYSAVTIVHEIFEAVDGRWIYVPKLKSYFTDFTSETLKISSSCASYNKYKFKFDLKILTAAFQVGSWQSSKEFQDQTNAFIEKFRKTNIANSENFFDGIFNSELPTIA